MGSRDETAETSGATHSIFLTPYKSMRTTVDTVNYGMVEMSGGKYSCNFDRERIWYKFQCLPHDVVDLFNMMMDCAFEPRNHLTCNAAMSKMPFSFRFYEESRQHFMLTDTILQAIYGSNGLGNPILGRESNAGYLNAAVIQKFQAEHARLSGVTVAATGIEDHAELEELVRLKLNGLGPGIDGTKERAASKFVECESKMIKSQKASDVALVFEAAGWRDEHVEHFHILRELLGGSAHTYSDPLSLNVGAGKLKRELYSQQASVKSVEAFNMHFSDTGVFGLRAQVAAGKENATLENIIKVLNEIDKADFELAKARLLTLINENMACDFARVEEYLKEGQVFGKVVANEVVQKIKSAGFEDFKKTVSKLKKSKSAFIAQSSKIAGLMSHDKLKSLLK